MFKFFDGTMTLARQQQWSFWMKVRLGLNDLGDVSQCENTPNRYSFQ